MTGSFSASVGIIQFSSAPYLIFLAVAVIAYFLLPGPRTRTAWLLSLSTAFYLLLSPRSFVVLIAVAAVSYLSGLLLERTQPIADDEPGGSARRLLLVATIVVLVGGLVAFKYLGFFGVLSNQVLGLAGLAASIPVLRFALPLGISFWTFQTVAYVVDVYKGKTPAEHNPFYFLLAVMFFPVVTSGPITRVQALVAQLKTKHHFDYDQMQSGLLLIGRGFFKKLMIADYLVVFVNTVFNDPQAYAARSKSVLLVAAVFFAIQLYCDFSGYTDIVRGSARLFGVELPINFRAPYFSRSVQDFWRRWHITLMDWLREYVYFPLGGSRVKPIRHYVNLLTVFAISGLWHGAGLTYLVWGLLNGSYQVAGQLLAPLREWVVRLLRVDRATLGHRIFQTVTTFALITVAWVFFRANTIHDALYIIRRMFVPTPWVFVDGTLLKQGLSAAELAIALVSASLVFGAEWLSLRKDLLETIRAQYLVYRWLVYFVLIFAIVVFGAYGGIYKASDFVYFKF